MTFFMLVALFAASSALVPFSMKGDPITYRGTSNTAVMPNFYIMGAAGPDTTSAPADSSRADSTAVR